MPTYEFECVKCGLKFERQQAMGDPHAAQCPDCGVPARLLVSGGAGFVIKGGGTGSSGKNCSLESTGQTCCGRDERCGKPPCGEES
jgi:putative FmdB family regulatory protein